MGKRCNAEEEPPTKKKLKVKKKSTKERHSSDASQHDDNTSKARSNHSQPAVSQDQIDKFLSSNHIEISDPQDDATKYRPIIAFDHLPISTDNLYEPLKDFTTPTPVQATTWPFLMGGRDVIGIAETGSGKTLAFGLPCLKALMEHKDAIKRRRPLSVILSPTRELAIQIYEQIRRFSEPVDLTVTCLFGGVAKDSQREALKKASIVVATPGRLKDLQSEGSVNLAEVKYLVLDEADRMLDKGFEQDIKDIIGTMPAGDRQTAMFTATWPVSVRKLASDFLNSPVTIAIGGIPSADPRANKRIRQTVEVVNPREKEGRLLELLKSFKNGPNIGDKVLVFCLYKKEATRIEGFIKTRGFSVAGIHGDLNQTDRIRSLDAFKSGSVSILVATDVAARGLDIPAVKAVINYTFPLTVEDYVHRIGR